uniref:40S ribosomal protein S12 n=2 Tax=Spongospora subterranea TaxID=70186 RepID=A0A0H5R4K3_9EUKA|eukprot:CRZ08816.1 hypothetical protein [Spongospora subterranea]
MSDTEQVEDVAVGMEEEAPKSIEECLQEVIKKSMVHDGLVRGLKESVKALDRREAHLCLLASSCDEAAYKKLVKAMCEQRQIPLIMVEDAKMLGEWAGLCKIDSEGKPVKIVGCACVVIKSWGEQSQARLKVLQHVKKA